MNIQTPHHDKRGPRSFDLQVVGRCLPVPNTPSSQARAATSKSWRRQPTQAAQPGWVRATICFILTPQANTHAYRISYRELLGTAERIIDMDQRMQEVDMTLGLAGQKCNSRAVDRISKNQGRLQSASKVRGRSAYMANFPRENH